MGSELESKCEYHKSLVLFDGRRPLPEAKIEVALRISEPFCGSEMVSENIEWCYIESKVGQSARVNPNKPVGKSNVQIRCLSLILNEIKTEDFMIEKSRKSQTKTEYQRHSNRKKQLTEEYNLTKKFVSASTGNRNQYILALKVELGSLNEEAKSFVQSGAREKAKLSLQKKKLIENELKNFSSTKTEYM